MEIRIRNSWCYLSGDIPPELLVLLSYVDKQQSFRQYAWSGTFNAARKFLIDRRRKRFPTGLLPLVQAKFPDCTYIDEREIPKIEWQPIPDEIINYKQGHQSDALEVMKQKHRGTIDGITAMGKTFVEAGFAAIFELPVLIITHRKEIAQNILKRCQSLVGDSEVGIIFSNKVDPRRVTVGMIGSLRSRMEDLRGWMQSLRAILIDESHHCSIGSQYFDFVQACENAYFRYGLTATPWRESGDTISVFSLTGPIIFSYPYSRAVKEGVVVPIEVFMTAVSPNIIMPILDSFGSVYEKGIVKNDERNGKIEKIVRHLNTKGENVLILVWRKAHGTLLQKRLMDLKSDFIHGTSTQRLEVKEKFENGELPILIASSIYDEGVDIERVQNVINAAGYKAPRLLIQRVGRGMRPFEGKTKCRVFDFFDSCHSSLARHARERLKLYKKMGFTIKELKVA